MTTAPNAPVKLTNSPTSKASDPPAVDPPPPSATLGTLPGTTSPSSISNGGAGAPQDLSQFNTGAQDLARLAISPPSTTDITSVTISGPQLLGASSPESAVPAVSAPTTTEGAVTSTVGTSIPNTGSVILPNAATSGAVPQGPVSASTMPNTETSGAVPQAPVSAAILPPTAAVVGTEGEVIATSGGSSGVDIGATGRDMPGCMAAWDKATHMTRTKWREVCAVGRPS